MEPREKIHESWFPYLNRVGNYYMYPDLLTNYYPERENVFNAFRIPFNDVKVVILGQDPYPRKGQSIGYAFSVPERVSKPASLKIIEEELGTPIMQNDLQYWVDQGVLLLNTALTVEKGKPGSHIEHWREFTNHVMYSLSLYISPVWMLWGKYAQGFISNIHNHIYEFPYPHEIDKNVVLTASHPAAEAYRKGAGFIGCKHFSKANAALKAKGIKEIIW